MLMFIAGFLSGAAVMVVLYYLYYRACKATDTDGPDKMHPQY
jgi:hypothetical protein